MANGPTKEELEAQIEELKKIAEQNEEINDILDRRQPKTQSEIKDLIRANNVLARTAARMGDISEERRRTAESYKEFIKLQQDALVNLDETATRQEKVKAIWEATGPAIFSSIEALEEFIEKGEKATEELENFNEVLSLGEKLGNDFFGGLAAKMGIAGNRLVEMRIRFEELAEEGPEGIAEFNKQFGKFFNMTNVGLSLLAKFIEATISFTFAVDKATAAFAANTGAGRALTGAISDVGSEFRNLGIDAEQAGKSAEALFGGFPGFLKLSEGVQKSMMKTVAGLDLLGVSMDDSVDSIMFFNKNLGATADSAANMTRELAMTGKSLGMTSSKIVKDFNKSLKTLAVYGDKAPRGFKAIAAQAAAAGVEIDSLMGLAAKFDTFQDAAETTGKLNAILGTQLSTTDLLMQTEEERIETLIRSIQAQGRSFKSLDRFTQKAVAAAAGIDDINEAQRIFGMSLGQYKEFSAEAAAAAKEEEEFNKRMQDAMSIMKKLKMIVAEFAIALGPSIDGIAAIVQGFLNFLSAGGGFFLKTGLIIAGVTAMSKVFWPFTLLLKGLAFKMMPGMTFAIKGMSTGLAASAPAMGAAGAGLTTLSVGLFGVVLPISLLIASVALLVFALADMFASLTNGIGLVVAIGLALVPLGKLIMAIAGFGIFAAFSFAGVSSGLRGIGEAIAEMDLAKLTQTANLMQAIAGLGGDKEVTATTSIKEVRQFIGDLNNNEGTIKPMLENLALVSVGRSAATMNNPLAMITSPLAGVSKAIKELAGERNIKLTLNADETRRLMKEGVFEANK